jgi:hypothetical protein
MSELEERPLELIQALKLISLNLAGGRSAGEIA